MNETVNKWEKTGLLKDLDEIKKVELSNKLEETAIFMLENKDILKKHILSCLLPAVARLYRKDNNIDVLILANELSKQFSLNVVSDYCYHIDYEAEVVTRAVENYINKERQIA